MPTKEASRKNIITIGLLVVLVVGLLITVIVIATTKSDSDENTDNLKGCPAATGSSRINILQWFILKDGLDVTWYSDTINTRQDAEKAAAVKNTIIDVQTSNQLSLEELLYTIKSSTTAVKNNSTFPSSANDIEDLMRTIDDTGFSNPVFVTLRVVFNDLNLTRYIQQALNSYSGNGNFIVNLDLTVCCQSFIGRGIVEYADEIIRSINISASVEVDAISFQSKQTWDNLRWLLEKNDGLTLIISQKSVAAPEGLFDILEARNDIEPNRIVYNLGTLQDEFKAIAGTGGSPLTYFNITSRDAGKIIWSHNTDTWEQLEEAITGNVMMIEGDIQCKWQGTPNQTTEPIMAHDYGEFNNITFEQWMQEIVQVGKGMKLDFKSNCAVAPALTILDSSKDNVKAPVWINADIQQGPGATPPRINYTEFLQDASIFPAATLSLGWTTVQKGSNYDLGMTMDMVEQMHEICKTLDQSVTFPARAEQLVASWDALDWLLKQSRGYTITVWTGHGDNVTREEMMYIQQISERSRIYFDLPEELRP